MLVAGLVVQKVAFEEYRTGSRRAPTGASGAPTHVVVESALPERGRRAVRVPNRPTLRRGIVSAEAARAALEGAGRFDVDRPSARRSVLPEMCAVDSGLAKTHEPPAGLSTVVLQDRAVCDVHVRRRVHIQAASGFSCDVFRDVCSRHHQNP